MKTGVIVVGKDGGKQESFRCTHLGHVKWSAVLSNPTRNGPDRPIWLSLAASPQEMRAVEANLRMGRTLKVDHRTLELLKTAPYVWSRQSAPNTTVLTVYLPDIFRLDPGQVDASGVQFYVLPPKSWCDDYSAKHRDAIARAVASVTSDPEYTERLTDLAPRAVWMLNMINSRTRCPVIREIAFALRVYRAASVSMMLDHGGDVGCLGMADGFGFRASHAGIGVLLAECVRDHFGISTRRERAA